MIRRTPLTLAVALATVLAGCAGPPEPLDVGVREVASDITIGAPAVAPTRVPPSPVPPTAVVVDLPVPSGSAGSPRFAPTPLPSSPPSTASPAPPPACPTADPLDSPDAAAFHDRAIPPVEATYAYRTTGTFAVSGANANEGEFDQPSTRRVQNVRGEADSRFTYEVAAALAGTVTTTTYEVRNAPTVADPTGVGAQANLDDDRGLYLASVRTDAPDGSTSTFEPATPLLLMPFPAFPDDAWDASGTDATSGTSMSFHGRVVGRADVDACGRFVDAFRIELSQGRVVGPLTSVEFVATYDLATQFGGLSVHDVVRLAGTEGLNTVERTTRATISEVPRERPS